MTSKAVTGEDVPMLGLRSKILLGFCGLLAILIAVSLLGSELLRRYSDATQRMLRDELAGVEAAQGMKDTLEALEAPLRGGGAPANPSETRRLVGQFEDWLRQQRGGSTLQTEQQATAALEEQWAQYRAAYERLPPAPPAAAEVDALAARAGRIRDLAEQIERLNVDIMRTGHGAANAAARRARFAMHALTLCGAVAAAVFAGVLARTILRPVRALTESVHQVEQGNLDLAVPVNSGDELGRLARAFNAMAAQLRVFRRIDHEKLMRTQETTQRAIDSLPDAVILVDPNGRVELANETARHLLAVAPQLDIPAMAAALVGEFTRAESPNSAGSRGNGNADRVAPSPLSPGAPRGFESTVRVRDADGERSFLPRPVPIRDHEGRLIGLTVVLADVTDLKRLDEMKNNLLSLVAHELKTPLTSMRMVLHLLVEGRIGALSPKQQELVVAARDDSDRLHQIIENLMDMARIESGKVLMETRPVGVAELVRSSLEPLRATFAEHGVALEVDVPEGGPGAGPAVLADPTRVGHVLANLLSNALKYTKPGGHVLVSAAAEEADGVVAFAVRDDGAGIPRQYVGRVFEKFFRAPGQPGDSGTGLGLAIVKDIVEAHGGRVSAESDAGRGTTFRFTLPLAAGTGVAPPTDGSNPGEPEADKDETQDLIHRGRGLPVGAGASEPGGGGDR
jgi:signal transduction histidine kinase/HAMP domain-containing protein